MLQTDVGTSENTLQILKTQKLLVQGIVILHFQWFNPFANTTGFLTRSNSPCGVPASKYKT